jgi:MoaA/NifB/PqqE/SkfB family radical SAM enzyme
MNKIKLDKLEYHLTNSCNLSCDSCSHYTNILKGNFKQPEELEKHLLEWSKILNIREFHIMGGEPFLNKNIHKFCQISKKILPKSIISIYTNGLLLSKIKNLNNILEYLLQNKIQIKLSIHSVQQEYIDELKPNLEILKYWESLGIKIIKIDSVNNWTKRYNTNIDGTISPFKDNDAKKSWEICPAKYCANLIDDKIYKCAPLAYLSYLKEAKKTSSEFDEYLKYKPISYNQPIEEIKLFFEKNNQFESFCNMCPSKKSIIENKKIYE